MRFLSLPTFPKATWTMCLAFLIAVFSKECFPHSASEGKEGGSLQRHHTSS